MKVLVTGASGMLGRAVARTLLARGDDVTLLQRGVADLPCRQVRADVADTDAVRRAVAGHDAVMHLAAKVDVAGPWREYERVTVHGTRNVAAACRATGAGRLVHVSSPSVAHSGASLVGAGADPPDVARTRGHYSRSKAVAERVALGFDDASLAVLTVRPHLVWGPGDIQLVGRFVDRARAGRLAVVGSGAPLVDTTYVTNAADALVAALDRCGPVHGEALVVSNGEPRPVGEIVARLCLAAGVPPPSRRVPFRVAWAGGAVVDAAWALLRPAGDPPITRFMAEQLATAHWFDQRRTREVLGWAPAVGLEEGFARLAAWYAGEGRSRGSGDRSSRA